MVSEHHLIPGRTGSARGRALPRQQREKGDGVGCTASGRHKGKERLQPHGGDSAGKKQGAASRSRCAVGQR